VSDDAPDDAVAFARYLERKAADAHYERAFRPTEPATNSHAHSDYPSFNGFITLGEFLAKMQPPDYVTYGLLLKGSTYTLTGNTGHGKTMITILLALKVALGEWFCGRKCKRGTVVFFAGENPDNVRVQFYAMCTEMGIDPGKVNIVFHEGVFDLKKMRAKVRAAVARYPDLMLVIVDSLQAFFTGDDDNANMAMLKLATDFRKLTEAHPNKPTTLITAHPVKNATQDNLLPRGGSALTNELDGNLTAWADGKMISLHWLGKLRGIPFDPIQLEQVVVQPRGLVDALGDQMPATIIKPAGESREAELLNEKHRVEIAMLAGYKANASITQRDLAAQVGASKSTVNRLVVELKKRKWIRDYSGKMTLTGEGEKALDLARSV
jgi:hypothetical protein